MDKKKKREKDHSPLLDLCTKTYGPYTLVVCVAQPYGSPEVDHATAAATSSSIHICCG